MQTNFLSYDFIIYESYLNGCCWRQKQKMQMNRLLFFFKMCTVRDSVCIKEYRSMLWQRANTNLNIMQVPVVRKNTTLSFCAQTTTNKYCKEN